MSHADDKAPTDAASLEERKFLFEQKKHADETKENERRFILQEKELSQKRRDPVVVALVAAVIAAFASVAVSYNNGVNQLQAESDRHEHTMKAEKFKSEAMMISESVKSTDKVQNACNLQKLIDFNLITNDDLKGSVNTYLRSRKSERVEDTKPATTTATSNPEEYSVICTISTEPIKNEVPQIAVATSDPTSQPDKKPSETVPDDEVVPSRGALIQSLDYSTGWMDGGHSQAEACSQALANYSPSFPGKILESGDASERSRKSTFGHVTYNYFCRVNVYEPARVKRF